MTKSIEDIFQGVINKNHPNVKPIPIKSQTYEGTNKFTDIFTTIILNKAEKTGYYK